MKQIAKRNTLKINKQMIDIIERMVKENKEGKFYLHAEDLPEEPLFVDLINNTFHYNYGYYLMHAQNFLDYFIEVITAKNPNEIAMVVEECRFCIFEHFFEDIGDLCKDIVNELNSRNAR